MKDFDLPALEYCSLDRASRLLGCELEDLLHWAEIRAIPLMVKFTNKVSGAARIEFSDSVDLYKSLRDIDPGLGDFLLSQFCSFSLTPDDYEDYEFNGEINAEHDMIEYTLECNLSGFWELANFSIDDGMVNLHTVRPFRCKHEWVGHATYWGGSEFSVSDLFISRESIELISGVRQRVLLSLANFQDEKPNNIIAENNPKTMNYRAMFIKSLLYVCYGEEAAESPRKFLDNPRSKIKVDFESKGLRIPSGKAIETWLKDIDIDKS
ncbi:hypothetical protein VWV82_004170 [Cronobacter malonaticus]|uniref:hypothetical protein n=1 Tax=Cronobacter TaxID=413496 RepID=UPI000518D58D|nr:MULTISPECIES: hypothetical protein [Cronobacter]EMD9275510.1 hypothetical protein [Cronobacter malonaticus]KIU59423.1 hypothetical protein CRSA0334_18415 [Cronobacter malonaticus ENBT0334]